MFFVDDVLEIRCVSGRLQVARKERHHDEWDRPVEAYDPYGTGLGEEDLTEFVADNTEDTNVFNEHVAGNSDVVTD